MKSSSSQTSRNVSRLQLLSRLLGDGTWTSLEGLLQEISAAYALKEAGLRWPVVGAVQVQASTGSTAVTSLDATTATQLAGARNSTEFVSDSRGSRLYIPLVLEGRRNGVLWVVPHRDAESNDEDQLALSVLAQGLVRHPLFLEKIGACDQIRVVQRLQDASVVAGKIAHDFDNIFTGVVGFAEMAQMLLTPGSQEQQYIKEIMSAGTRGIDFTKQLHQLSRSGMVRPLPTSLRSVLSREETRLKSPTGVRIQFSIPGDLPPIAMDAGAMQQALAHVLDNAVEASPSNGTIHMVAQLIELSDVEAREYHGNASAGPFVSVRITDEGPGIKDENRKKLFVEPFFTTKVRHRGLGLAVVYRILHSHRGGVRLETSSSRGCTIEMVLPLAARSPETDAAHETNRFPGGLAR